MISDSEANTARRARRLAMAASALLALLLYAPTLRGTWIYDDRTVAYRDPRLHDVHRWRQYLTDGWFVHGGADHLWRPLVSLSFAAQWWAHGERAWAFHLVNILLYAGGCAIIAGLAFELSPAPIRLRAAVLSGLLFSAHPLHVEAVAYLVGRAETASALGVLGALLIFIKKPLTTRRALAIHALFLVAILSKEQGLLLPFMLLAAWWIWQDRPVAQRSTTIAPDLRDAAPRAADGGTSQTFGPAGASRRAFLLLVALITLTLAIYIQYRDHILPWLWDWHYLDVAQNPLKVSQGADRWLIPVSLLGRYAALFVFPIRMSPDYGLRVIGPALDVGDPYFWCGWCVLLVYIISLAWSIRIKHYQAMFCLICLAISYFLISNIVMIGTIFAERLMYLPSAFALILAGGALARIPRRWGIGIGMLIIVLFSIRTMTYATQWNDRLAFYQQAVANQPDSDRLRLLLGYEFEERGNLPKALAQYEIAQTLAADDISVWLHACQASLKAGRLDHAQYELDQAMRVNRYVTLMTDLRERLFAARQAKGSGGASQGAGSRPASGRSTTTSSHHG